MADTRPILFATSREDATAYCVNNGLKFEDVIFVLNIQLLGNMPTAGHPFHITEAYKEVPAYYEAKGFVESRAAEEAETVEGEEANG